MESWKSVVHDNPIEWLLGEENPSVRYFTLRDLLEKPVTNSEVKEAKRKIMEFGVVPAILEKQTNGGYWSEPERFYSAKY
jgi:hypothetical protein